MELEIDGTTVKGQYQSKVSDDGGPTPWFPLVGTVSNDLIAFTVNWGPEITSGSVTGSWKKKAARRSRRYGRWLRTFQISKIQKPNGKL